MKDSAGKKKGSNAVGSAFRLLSYRDRSEKELVERLRQKGFSEQAVQDALEYLKEKGFIDNERLARSLKRYAEEVKLLGVSGSKGFLRQRGIPEKIIRDVIRSEDQEEIERAKKIAEKKLRTLGDHPDNKIREKLWRLLVRKGYSSGTVRQILRNLKTDEEDME